MADMRTSGLMRNRNAPKWEQWEDDVLNLYYSTEGPRGPHITAALGGRRTAGAIRGRARRFGLSTKERRQWSVDQERELLKCAVEMSKRTGHTPTSCATRIVELARRFKQSNDLPDADGRG